MVLNIREYLKDEKLGEEHLRQLLSEFSCPLNPDVERFVVNGKPFSNTVKRKLARFSELNSNEQFNLAAYLIAQLGKNFSENVKGRITGTELLEAAMTQARLLQYQAGGMVSFVEADNNEKVLSFYENYGYKRFDTRITSSDEPHELIQLLKLI